MQSQLPSPVSSWSQLSALPTPSPSMWPLSPSPALASEPPPHSLPPLVQAPTRSRPIQPTAILILHRPSMSDSLPMEQSPTHKSHSMEVPLLSLAPTFPQTATSLSMDSKEPLPATRHLQPPTKYLLLLLLLPRLPSTWPPRPLSIFLSSPSSPTRTPQSQPRPRPSMASRPPPTPQTTPSAGSASMPAAAWPCP